ncbi:hypothetical protein OWR29_39065 [Actinoplanes sp. Pm04-4]|uniref:Uncharacterized protein n=1 Tax=Paractinoplanes pyxinae TaxID=2997416 RepID=A0ABT4BC22_9ACTN|nr:hypothetical protein [Actinoplanes pyxinae]MCY1144032.1 hypothetical protein [Actinoplanes pyxinae]
MGVNIFEPVPESQPPAAAPPHARTAGSGEHPVPAAADAGSPRTGSGAARAGAAPVAVTPWRITDLPSRHRPAPAGALSARTAARLIGAYSRAGDIIVSVGDDPALAGAAGAGGHRYHGPAAVPELCGLRLDGAVTLIVLPWPQAAETEHDPQAPFRCCRRLLKTNGSTVVVFRPGPDLDKGTDHHGSVVTAAWQAGLACSQSIVAVGSRHRRRRPGAPSSAAAPATALPVVQFELLVFTLAQDRHG